MANVLITIFEAALHVVLSKQVHPDEELPSRTKKNVVTL